MRLSACSVQEKKKKLDGAHLVLPYSVDTGKEHLQTTALVDSGANGIAFIDQTFVRNSGLPLLQLRKPRRLEVANGHQSAAGRITHLVRLPIEIQGHRESLPCFVTKLSQHPIVLGRPWMQIHDPTSSWRKNTLTFASSHCRQACGFKRCIAGYGWFGYD